MVVILQAVAARVAVMTAIIANVSMLAPPAVASMTVALAVVVLVVVSLAVTTVVRLPVVKAVVALLGVTTVVVIVALPRAVMATVLAANPVLAMLVAVVLLRVPTQGHRAVTSLRANLLSRSQQAVQAPSHSSPMTHASVRHAPLAD